MASSEIVLQPQGQQFTLQLRGVVYKLRVRWMDALLGGWMLDILTEQGVPIVTSLPLVTGSDLLAQHRHLGLGIQLIVASSGDVDSPPTLTGLGTETRLYMVTDV